jgi:Ca2+/Na+ antiporter
MEIKSDEDELQELINLSQRNKNVFWSVFVITVLGFMLSLFAHVGWWMGFFTIAFYVVVVAAIAEYNLLGKKRACRIKELTEITKEEYIDLVDKLKLFPKLSKYVRRDRISNKMYSDFIELCSNSEFAAIKLEKESLTVVATNEGGPSDGVPVS